MKVVYEEKILERIRKAVRDAEALGHRVEHIDLTLKEANHWNAEMCRLIFLPTFTGFTRYTKEDAGKEIGTSFGVPLRIEP